MDSLLVLGSLAFIGWRVWGRSQFRLWRATSALATVPNFSANYLVIGTEGIALAMDVGRKKIAFVDPGGPAIYKFKDIITVEPNRNISSRTKTRRINQLFAVTAGHLLFGEKGFITGGSTAATMTSELTSCLSLKVYLNDAARPVREIKFYEGAPLQSTHRRLTKSVAVMNEWYGRLRMALASP